jgi:hypothetical protein
MRITDPAQLRETKQPLTTEQLLRLAHKWGFETRQSGHGSSHIRCTHKKYPDIGFNIIRTTERLSSQRNLADAMAEIEKRKAAAKQAIRDKFSVAAEDRLNAIREKLPAHITATLTQDGLVVLRDAQIPQIGVTLYSQKEDRLIENKIHNEIEPMKREIYIALSRLHTEYDAQAQFDDGVFTGCVSHEVYETLPDLVLPPYEAGGSILDIRAAIHAYQDAILSKDIEHMIRKEELLSDSHVGGTMMTFSARRGERNNHVRLNVGAEQGALSFTFKTFSNRRITGDGSAGRIAESELNKMEKEISNATLIDTQMRRAMPEYRAA